jgi:hypothetical protein
MNLVKLLLVVMTSYSASAFAKTEAEFSASLPKFAPQPSATLIYCKTVLSQSMRGLNGDAKTSPAVTSSISKLDSRLMLQFSATYVLVASSIPTPEGGHIFGPGFQYKILNDNPENFIAIQDRAKTGGLLQAIAINRIAGTLIWDSIEASLPEVDHPGMQGHPYVSSTFYVCSPADN